MINLKQHLKKFTPRDYWIDYKNADVVPHILFENFFPEHIYKRICYEIDLIPNDRYKKFTRNNSYMDECNDFSDNDFLYQLSLEFNGSEFVNWLEKITKEEKLIPDCHLIGAGLMRCRNGNSLKMHTDFNWNEELHLNRKVNVIYYCSKEWKSNWGGDFHMQLGNDLSKQKIIQHVPNSLLIWTYNPLLWHGHPNDLKCEQGVSRDGIRFFYYQSNSTPTEKPHRSLYYQDEKGNPIDKKD